MSNKTFTPIVSESLLSELDCFYAYHRTTKQADGTSRDYIVLTSQPQSVTMLDGVEVQASFRPPTYEKPSNIYLEVSVDTFKSLIAQNDDSNIFWCKQGYNGDNHTILSEKKFAEHQAHFNPAE